MSARRPLDGLLLGALCLALAACTAPEQGGKRATPANEGSGRAVVADQSKKVVSVLWQKDFSFVRIEDAEGDIGVPNDHPITLSPRQIREALGQLQVQRGRTTIVPVFLEQELDQIAGPIAAALLRARPMQDVTFAVTGKKGLLLNPFNRRVVTTGRVFYLDGELNVIFGLVHGQYEGRLQASGYLRPFTPGSREGPAARDGGVLPATTMQYAAAGRQDWVLIPLQVRASRETEAEPAPPRLRGRGSPLAVPPDLSVPPALSLPRPNAAPTAVEPAPRTAPTVSGSQAPAAPPEPGSEDHYRELERRLEVLKTLWEKRLITKEQYEEKSRAILDEL